MSYTPDADVIMIVVFVWLYAWALGNLNMSWHSKIFKMKYTMTPICSFQINESSALDRFVSIILIFSVEVELHDRSKRRANLW
jgi:hypothetical protein